MPTGLDTSFYTPRKRAVDPRSIVFLGPLHTSTQRDALQHFVRDMLPNIEQRVGRVREHHGERPEEEDNGEDEEGDAASREAASESEVARRGRGAGGGGG